MIKCKFWKIIYREPFCFYCIIFPLYFNRLCYNCKICNTNSTSTWISVNFGESTNLIQTWYFKTCFFF